MRYKDKVKVVTGFYSGQSGTAVRYKKEYIDCDPQAIGHWQTRYRVKLNDEKFGSVWVDAEDVVKVAP